MICTCQTSDSVDFFNIFLNHLSKDAETLSYIFLFIAIFELNVKLSTDRYINSAATRRDDSYSRGVVAEYTVMTQRAANCKASTTVVHASQIISGNVTWHTRPLAALARSPDPLANSSRATHVVACARARSSADKFLRLRNFILPRN